MTHDFIKALQKDHEEQRELTEKFKNSDKPAEWKSLFQEIQKELKPHVEGEEASFFPKLKENSDRKIRLETLEKLQEHHVMDLLLEEARKMDPSSEEFAAKIKVLLEINEHHIDEEEEETFEAMKKQFSDKELDLLFDNFKNEKEKVKKEIG
jgi:hemerythrin-like domain-containing protein